ncbi:hypothetical protein KI387_024634, partial [Taxus chinensis]
MAATTPDGPAPLASHRRPFAHRRNDSFADNGIWSGCPSNVSTMDEVGRRKAEEAASRRFQAAAWIMSMAGPLDMSYEPSEEEFRLCLRNGLILCSLINKVQPGAVPKVVENIPSLCLEGQPLSAYQYFENVRNFLVAVEDLKLPTFEASDLEQGSLQAGSTTKIVDCILALKSYYEWKKSGEMVLGSTQLDLSGYEKSKFVEAVKTKESDSKTGQPHQDDFIDVSHFKDPNVAWLRRLVVGISDSKENIDQNLFEPLQTAALNGSTETLMNLIFATLQDKQRDKNLLLCSASMERKNAGCTTIKREHSKHLGNSEECQICLESQRKQIMDIRVILQRTREDVQFMQTENQKQIGIARGSLPGYPAVDKICDGWLQCLYFCLWSNRIRENTHYGEHTSGPTGGSEKEMGVNFRALSDLFQISQKRKDLVNVLTVHVQGTDRVSGCTFRSCLHLVDLAGSERVDKSEVTGDRLKEALHINKSLSSLGDVIAALAQKNSHGVQAKTLMFVHISPELDSYGETLSTLKFAERVASVELGTARVNKESAEVRELKEQVDFLKKALSRKEAELGNSQAVKASPLIIERHKPKIEKTPVRSRRLSLDGPGCGNTEQFKEGMSKLQDRNNISNFGVVSLGKKLMDTGDNAKLNNTEMHTSKSIGYGSDRRCSLNGKANLPPRTPEHPSMGNESSEKMKSEARTLNVIVTAPKKPSNIKKSLQTFGRFMNVSERRSPKQAESSLSPVSSVDRRFSSGGQIHPSPRRQSLTGALSRRASIAGRLPAESMPIACKSLAK